MKEEKNDTTSNKPDNTNKIDETNNNNITAENSKKENTTTEVKNEEKAKVEEIKSEGKDENREKVEGVKINIQNTENTNIKDAKSENTNTTNNKPNVTHLNDDIIRKHCQNPSIIPEESETEDEKPKSDNDEDNVKRPTNMLKRLSDSNVNSSFHSKIYAAEGQSNEENSLKNRKFSLDSNSKNHIVNDTVDVCTPLQSIDNPYEERTEDSKKKDNSIFLTDHSAIPLPSYYERLQNEVQLMMRLDHPNIIKIYQVIESEDETLIVM